MGEAEEQTIDSLDWLSSWELLGKSKQMFGKNQGQTTGVRCAPEGIELTVSPDSVWLRINQTLIPLWPLAAHLGRASIQGEGKQKTSKDEAPQVYSRKESVRLGYVPLGAEGWGMRRVQCGCLGCF